MIVVLNRDSCDYLNAVIVKRRAYSGNHEIDESNASQVRQRKASCSGIRGTPRTDSHVPGAS
jgi:hypothetical protein